MPSFTCALTWHVRQPLQPAPSACRCAAQQVFLERTPASVGLQLASSSSSTASWYLVTWCLSPVPVACNVA